MKTVIVFQDTQGKRIKLVTWSAVPAKHDIVQIDRVAYSVEFVKWIEVESNVAVEIHLLRIS